MLETRCAGAKTRPHEISQVPEIIFQKQKVDRPDHFCLTEIALEGYLASSPQAVVVARRLPAQPVVGGLWKVGVYLGMAGGLSLRGVVRLGGGILWR